MAMGSLRSLLDHRFGMSLFGHYLSDRSPYHLVFSLLIPHIHAVCQGIDKASTGNHIQRYQHYLIGKKVGNVAICKKARMCHYAVGNPHHGDMYEIYLK